MAATFSLILALLPHLASSSFRMKVAASVAKRFQFGNNTSIDVVLIRHGESLDNVFPRQGPFGLVDPVLSERGRAQAVNTGACLSSGAPFDLVFSSVLQRAEETALLAFPGHKAVHVAPFVSELQWGMPLLHPSAAPLSRSEQEAWARNGTLHQDWSPTLSFDWAPPQSQCGPPDWERFLSWLAYLPALHHLLSQNNTFGVRPRIAVATHGLFLRDLGRRCRYDTGPVANAQAILAELPLTFDDQVAELRFGDLKFVGTVCPGEFGPSLNIMWAAIFAMVSCCACITSCLLVSIVHAIKKRAASSATQPFIEAAHRQPSQCLREVA